MDQKNHQQPQFSSIRIEFSFWLLSLFLQKRKNDVVPIAHDVTMLKLCKYKYPKILTCDVNLI